MAKKLKYLNGCDLWHVGLISRARDLFNDGLDQSKVAKIISSEINEVVGADLFSKNAIRLRLRRLIWSRRPGKDTEDPEIIEKKKKKKKRKKDKKEDIEKFVDEMNSEYDEDRECRAENMNINWDFNDDDDDDDDMPTVKQGAMTSDEAFMCIGIDVNEETITEEAFKIIFRYFANKHHPDKGGDTNNMIKINEAKRVLSKYHITRI